jgi:hypothetical protein
MSRTVRLQFYRSRVISEVKCENRYMFYAYAMNFGLELTKSKQRVQLAGCVCAACVSYQGAMSGSDEVIHK